MIKIQLEILAQAHQYLESVTIKNYQKVLDPQFISSSGAHIRHIIDHYLAIISGIEQGCIDYDIRSRNSDIESSPIIAIQKIVEISNWLKSLTDEKLAKNITLSTEVSVSEQKISKVSTTLARELVFASSHAVHHYAMIAQIAFAQHVSLPISFGLAPATASYLRKSA